ncbi:MAG: hypothetical protein WCH01_23245, partial [Methylococcaceae bacterium]
MKIWRDFVRMALAHQAIAGLAITNRKVTQKITKAGTAIADCLSKMTGLTFKIEVGTTFGASIEAMGANKAQVG